ncbi:CU044_5270 family protein [Streptomyces sp. NPDC059766]|uniref:CU044_5270 family protein n=1 Tax=Streptomyces sp. NPDC059766 TaxID=3346940 RepID=UPI00366947CA
MTDELELLRDWDTDAAPLADPARAEARHRLLNTIARAQHSEAAPSRRHALRLATAAVVAVAVTGGAVLIAEGGADRGDRSDRVSGTATPRMANVGAVTVLNRAAAQTGRNEKPVAPRDDQFIYSKRNIKETERGTGAVKTYEDVNWDSVDGSKRSLTMELGRVIWEEPLKKGEGVWPPREWSELKKLPTDPEKLIPVITDLGSSSRSTSDFTEMDWFDAYFMLGELLKWPVLPQGLRPAAYKALALVPGVEAIPGVKDSAGRTGVGIACPRSPLAQGKYLIFDPKSYDFLGFRDERTSASGDKTYIQLSHVVEWAIVDRMKERP